MLAELESSVFTAREVSDLSDHLLAIHAAPHLPELLVSTAAAIHRFIPADHWGIGVCDPRRKYVYGVGSSSRFSAETCPIIRTHSHQSPLLRYWAATGQHDRVIRLSDAAYPGFRSTALYADYFRRFDLRQQMGTWIRPGGGHHFEIGVYRTCNTDFSDRDVARLALLRGHILQAYRRCLATHDPSRPDCGEVPRPAGYPFVELHPTSLSTHLDGPRRLAGQPRPQPRLTPREREVLGWVAQGKTNPEIATILGTSWRTVQKHVEHLFQKLGVETRTAAALRAIEWSLL